MIRTTRWSLTAALFAVLAATPALAQRLNLDGLPIQEIEFVGLESLAAETVEFYLGLEDDAVWDPAALNQRIHELWQRELIDDIQVDPIPVAGGVKLVVTVVERPLLRSVEYVGLKRIERSDITDRIAQDRLRVREGDPLNLGDIQRLQRVIEELYRDKGFRLARAAYHVEDVSTSDRRVTFTIDEGDKVKISEIDFEGNTVFGDRRLRWAMKKTKESSLLTKLSKADVYNPAKLEEDLDLIREIYHKAGYKNVVLGEPRTDVRATRPGAESVDDERRRLFLTVPVEEGGRWRLGEVSVEGNETFSDELLLAQFTEPKGGWLRSNVVDEAMETINELYQNTGHLFARVDKEVVERDDLVADVVVHVEEGEQFSIGRIEFTGNRTTRDKVLRRELGVQEGMVMNQGALRNSLLRLQQLEFFQIDETDPVAFDLDQESKLVNLDIKGEEGDRTEMQFGAGFSELDGFFGQFQFRSRNFLGRGETLGVSLQSGRRQDIFDVSYFVPWFLDRPQNAGAQVFSRNLEYNLLSGQRLKQETLGATLTYGRRLALFSNLSLSYSRYDSDDLQTFVGLDGELQSVDVSRSVSSMRMAYSFDRRDSRLEPTRGMQYTGSLEYAGGLLGGTTNFIRPRGSFSFYKPLTQGVRIGTVGAVNFEAGYIQSFGDQELFFFDRFYLGGENSIRGFNFRSIWVRDDQNRTATDVTGFPLGGNSMLQFNFEYHILFGGPFRVLAFLDAGNVYSTDQTPSIEDLRYSVGLEMRVMVPIFGAPLRFIYAQNPNDFPDDRFETFQFSVGTTF